jgi:4-hydroxybenzoate polyprenyltransferase
VRDAEADRLHPKKRLRPIASGKVSVKTGYGVMVAAMVGAVALALSVGTGPTVCIGIYLLINIAYCLKLKQVAILDVALIAIGFVLRVLGGGMATGIWISEWLVLMTFLLTLLLALAKRNDDFRIYELTGQKPRQSITGYNHEFINEVVSIVAAVTLVCYIMYTMSPDVTRRMGTRYVYLTSFWVLAGLFRYLQNMIVYKRSGSPTKAMVKDRFLQICVLGWIASFVVIIYLI